MALTPLPDFPEVPPGPKHLDHSAQVEAAVRALHADVPQEIDNATSRPFNPQGAWDAGTAYETNDAVTHDGSTWVARPGVAVGDEPGVSATWLALNVLAVDDTARADIGTLETEVAGKQRAFQLDVRGQGAVGDGIADDTAAIQAAIDASGGWSATIRVPEGTYRLTDKLTLPANVTLQGDGAASVLLLDGAPSAVVSAAGTIPGAATATLTVDAEPGATTLTLNDTSSLTAGDVLLLGDDSVPDPTQPTRLAGEMVRVASVDSATVVTIEGRVSGAFGTDSLTAYTTAASGKVFKLTMVEGVEIHDLTIRSNVQGTTTTTGLLFTACRDVVVSNVDIAQLDAAAVQLQHVMGGTIDVNVSDLTDDIANSRYGYGVNIAGATCDVTVTGRFRRCRHAFTTNGLGGHGIPRRIVVDGAIATETSHTAFDTHAHAETVTFSDCLAEGCATHGFVIRGRNVTVTDFTVINCGNGLMVAEAQAQDATFRDGVVREVPGNPFKVRDDGCKRITLTGVEFDGSDGTLAEVAAGTDRFVAVLNRFLNAGLSASQGNGIQAVGTTPGTGWVIGRNLFAKTGTAGTYRNAVLLTSGVTDSFVHDNVGYGTRTDLPFISDAGGNRQRNNVRLDQGTSIIEGTAAPTTGTWKVGDQVRNTAPTAGGVIGWVCTTAGTPGTWKSYGAISA